jgi:N-ethylmaleimide reductase
MRAEGGFALTMTCAASVQEEGVGFPGQLGFHDEKHLPGLTRLASKIKEYGSHAVGQLHHGGLRSLTNPKAPSDDEKLKAQAMTLDEIQHSRDCFISAAQRAERAGFDGVELHGANGYLPDQFLRDGVNHRTDEWGGSIENRARFHIEATRALVEVWGADRVGVRLSPSGTFNDMKDSNPKATFGYLISALGKFGLAYLHIMEAMPDDLVAGPASAPGYEPIPVHYFRPMFKGALVTNSAFDFAKAQHYIQSGWADAVAFGQLFIANPDLPVRFARMAAGREAPFNPPNYDTFYGGGAPGYTDYPALAR